MKRIDTVRAGLVCALLTVTTAVTVGAATVAPEPLAAATRSSGYHPRNVTLTSGVRVTHQKVRVRGSHKVWTHLMRIDLRNKHLRLNAVTPGQLVGSKRQTVAEMARRTHAIAGINTDFFDLKDRSSPPRGGVIRSGHVVKSPRRFWDGQFWVSAAGRAHIGQVQFRSTLTRAKRATSTATSAATSQRLYSVNVLHDLASGQIVMLTSELVTPVFGQSCTVAVGQVSKSGRRTVSAVYPSLRKIRRLAPSHFALVACASSNHRTWLQTQVRSKDVVGVSTAYASGRPQALVSGGRQLVKHGRQFNDAGGQTIAGNRPNPETFACVSRNGLQVVLGTVDGRIKSSDGVNFGELTRYLVALKCWDGVVFDGGGSTTLVGRSSASRPLQVLNRPSEGSLRAVPAALMLYRR